MDWRDQWKALSAAADGATAAAREFIRDAGAVHSDDFYGITNSLLNPQLREVVQGIRTFVQANADRLDGPVADGLVQVLTSYEGRIGNGGFPATQALLAVAASGKAGVDRLLADDDVIYVPQIERAFAHLQRQIVADRKGVGERWRDALRIGETECERLGGAHLLSHGIFGFKAHGPGARTDLVLGTPVTNDDEAKRLGAPLVLTEWKVARNESDAATKVAQADTQVVDYSRGVLGGFELQRTRYVIVVSSNYVALPQDKVDGQVRYRRINIAVDPLTPSKHKAPAVGRRSGTGGRAKKK